MAAIKNAIDTILQATTPRIIPASLPPNIIVGGGNLGAGTGKNLLSNAGFYLGLDKWTYTSGFALNLTNWFLPAIQSTAYFGGSYAAGTGDAYLYLSGTQRVPVIQNQIVEISAYVAAHRCTCQIYHEFFDSAGASLGLGTWIKYDHQNLGTHIGGVSLDGYKRCYAFARAPAGAVSVSFVFSKGVTAVGQTSSYGFFVMPYLGIAGDKQTELSTWADGIGGQTEIITPTNYKNYLAAQSVSGMAYSINNSTVNTNNATLTTSLNFDSDGQNVLAQVSGYLASSQSATSGGVSLALKLVVGGSTVLDLVVASFPNSTTTSKIVSTTTVPYLIASPGTGSVTYTLTLTFTYSGNGSGQLGGYPTLILTGLKR